MLHKKTFIKLMHMAASVKETRTVPNNSPARLIDNYNNSQFSYSNQISNLQTVHILRSQS